MAAGISTGMSYSPPQSVIVKRTKDKGRGVFASESICRGDIIERSPVLKLDDESGDVLPNYCYAFGRKLALGLGYLSLYNHSRSPNAKCYLCGHNTIEIVATRVIGRGEEVTINYGSEFKDNAWY